MGCGALCGDATSFASMPLALPQNRLKQLLPGLKNSKYFPTEQQLLQFIAEVEANGCRFHLTIKQYISDNEFVHSGVREKWKLLLYGLDHDIEIYCNCLKVSAKSQQDLQLANSLPVKLNDIDDELNIDVYFHDSFIQIEKDLERSLPLPQSKKKSFEMVLKRIANHFPRMGYTQGINFVIGYLLIIGYSQTQSFWIFAHIALNKRYLLLGLYEDGFPLSNVYSKIFSNILKRLDNKLHYHLYDTLMLSNSLWIFKWFVTSFLYSFPIAMCKYVWDFVVVTGGIGLVIFAVAITLELKEKMQGIMDSCDVSQFLTSLKDIDTFNRCVNMRNVMESAYLIKISKEDYEGISDCSGGFYAEYLLAVLEEQSPVIDRQLKTTGKSIRLLTEWYNNIINDRKEFEQKHKPKEIMDRSLSPVKQVEYEGSNQQDDILPSIPLSHIFEFDPQSERQAKYASQLTAEQQKLAKYLQKVSKLNSSRLKAMKKSSVQINEQLDEQGIHIKQYLPTQHQIPQVTGVLSTNASFTLHRIEIEDQLDRAQVQFEVNKYHKSTQISLVGKSKPLRRLSKRHHRKINNFGLEQVKDEKPSGLKLAGQNVLSNISISGSQKSYSISSSKNGNHHDMRKSKKENESVHMKRHCGCNKLKTQQNKLSLHDHSQRQSSEMSKNTDKESVSNMSQQDYHIRPGMSVAEIDSNCEIVAQQLDFMVSSHGLYKKKDISGCEIVDLGAEIELFGAQLFKKKNRFHPRLIHQNICSASKEPVKLSIQRPQLLELGKEDNEEESCQSIFTPVCLRPSASCQPSPSFEVQCVK